MTIIFNNERVRFVIGRITNKFKSQKSTESNFFYSVYIYSLHYFESCYNQYLYRLSESTAIKDILYSFFFYQINGGLINNI